MRRRWVFALVVLALVGTMFGALPAPHAAAIPLPPTYTWNQAGSASWVVATNWTPTRTTPTSNDRLVFSGGGSVTATNVLSETIGQLTVSGTTTVYLQAGGANTLTIGGGTGTDLDVAAGSSLNTNGANALTIFLGAGATGSISGSMTCSTAAHKLNATDASAITFNSGAIFTQDTGCVGNAFTNAGTANVIVFASGSTFIFKIGSNPFGLTQPSSKVVFQGGSLYRHESSNTPSFSGRTYANVELNTANTINCSGSAALSIDNLTITDGTLNLNMTGIFNLKGNISVASGKTLNFSPTTSATLTFSGATQQTIGGAGTLTFGANQNVVLANANGLLLQKDVTLNGALALTLGDIDTGVNTLTLGSATGTNTSGGGDVVGNVKRGGFAAGTAYSFGNPNVSLNFASGVTLPTDVTVNLAKSQPANFGSYAVNRSYTITPNSGSDYSVTVRLRYLETELNGNNEANLELWRYGGAAWTRLGKSSSDMTDNWVELGGVTAFSPWAISATTTNAVSLRTLTATPTPLSPLVVLPILGLMTLAGLAVYRRRRTSQP